MTNYRNILELHSQGHSQRSIEASVHSSHQTVRAVLDRVRKPQDKGLVEKSVGFSTTWITAALRERKFFHHRQSRY